MVREEGKEELQKIIKETKELLFDEQEDKLQKKVNINTASKEDLMLLPGIGPAYADRIIEYRNKKHSFRDIAEIMEVKGIGEKTFDQLKDKITVE
jgi:competence protein ComEA